MIHRDNIRQILDESTRARRQAKAKGEAVPYELRVGVELQSRRVRIPMQCPDTAKSPGGVSKRERQDRQKERGTQDDENKWRRRPKGEARNRC